MDRFCARVCPYRDYEEYEGCALPVLPERVVSSADRVVGYLISSMAISGNALSGRGDMHSALFAQRAAAERVAARRLRIEKCITFHRGLVKLLEE